MSISLKQSELSRHQKTLADLQKKSAEESKKEVTKTKDLHRIEKSITKSTSDSSFRSKQQQMNRIMEDISKIRIKKADISKKNAQVNEKIHKAQDGLRKEEDRERKKVIDSDKRREKEQLIHQRAITQELQTQYSIRQQGAPIIETRNVNYDVFVSHASEDKEGFVKPLVEALTSKGYEVWYDEYTLKIGDSLRRSIDIGLSNSRYGIVVLSESFFKKNWTQHELDGLVTKEMEGHKVILPIWHMVTKDQVRKFSVTLADKMALNTSLYTIDEIVEQLTEVLDENKLNNTPTNKEHTI
ncbi:MAG: toll/interleukin-1 receptor domain-containing protein [Fibrobacterales bacterium]